MPTLTLGDLDQRVAALDARVRALEASHPPADTSVSPETRSADSGPGNARHEGEIANLKRQLELVTKQRDEYQKALLSPAVRPLGVSPAFEEETANIKRQLSALQALVRERSAENARLEGVVEQQLLELGDRDNELRALKESWSRDREAAGKWWDLVNKLRDDE